MKIHRVKKYRQYFGWFNYKIKCIKSKGNKMLLKKLFYSFFGMLNLKIEQNVKYQYMVFWRKLINGQISKTLYREEYEYIFEIN